jgi:hypothetical protein
MALLIATPQGSLFAYEAMQGSSGVIIWDEANAFNGYTLISPASETTTYLIDMEGYIVHKWETDSSPGLHCRLLENGNLLRGFRPEFQYDGSPVGGGVSIGGQAGGVQEFDWDGNLVWEYINKTDTSVQHHTFTRLPNGNTLVLLWEKIECVDAIAMGRDSATCVDADGLWPDMIEEVDHPAYPGIPAVQWTWRVLDHIGTGPGQFDINFFVPNIPWGYKDWNHGNTVEYNAVTDQIIFNSRNWGEFYVIDKPTGNVVFRWGSPGSYGDGELPSFNDDGDQVLFGPHAAVWLGTGDNTNFGTLGNILIFDNGWNRPAGNRSRSVEMTPNFDIDPLNWKDSPIVWSYQAGDQGSFYTAFQGASQRLPNGNTFITSTGEGHLIQVTDEKDVVWDFVMPRKDSDGFPMCSHFDSRDSSIHRAHQYGSDHPGLVGKNLSRKGHIAGDCPQMWKLWGTQYAPSPQVAPTGWGTGNKIGAGGGGGAAAGAGGAGGY